MFESRLLQQCVAKRLHEAILALLKDRFGTVPRSVTKPLREILDEEKLQKFILLAAKCPDVGAFREALLS